MEFFQLIYPVVYVEQSRENKVFLRQNGQNMKTDRIKFLDKLVCCIQHICSSRRLLWSQNISTKWT